ncbi:MAG TPA: sialidase family protein [Gemmatimonadales bacterium]
MTTALRCGSLLALVALLAACGGQPRVALGEATAVSAHTEGGAAPILALAPDGARTVAWVSAPDGGSDGRLVVATGDAPPVEVRDTLGPIEVHGESPPKLAYGPDGTLHAIYVVGKVVPGRRFPLSALRYVRSADRGVTWSEPVSVTDDAVFGSHNFHSLHAGPDGTVYVAWLDGRDGKSATYMTRSTDGGASWAPNVRVAPTESCPCCRTAIASAADGTVYLAWRTVMPGNVRDVVVARSPDRGATWEAPLRVHADDWVFDGCPHAGPSLAVDAEGRLHVAWWTGREGSAGVWYARSDDGARSFSTPVAMGVAEFSRPAHAQLALGADDRVVVAWDDGTLATPRIALRASNDGGRTFGPALFASDSGRAAAFPVLAVDGRRVSVAWSEQSREAADHVAAHAPDMKDPGAVKGLAEVGEQQVLLRAGELQ